MSDNTLTLYELNTLVHSFLDKAFPDSCWVMGELSDAGAPAFGGHFYGELVQKDERTDAIVARARVTCWSRIYNMLRLRLQQEAGETLRKGLQVKLLVKVNFHAVYGYSLNILDIDSSFTLGDLAKRRREILLQLERDGILHDNQQLPLPRLLRRIAVVSSPSAAGYGDFCNQLENNDYGFHFDVRLFPSLMQGAQVPESVMAALQSILSASSQEEPFDIVVVIRGGGASIDLSDFDNYDLAAAIAQFPIPVVIGIGHERDETVLDFVAHTRVKTPTAAAAFIIDHQAQEAALLDDYYQRITRSARERILREKQRLQRYQNVLPLLFSGYNQKQQNRLQLISQRLSGAIRLKLERERNRHQLLSQRLESLDPRLLLRRGYTITTCGGKIVRSAEGLCEGEVLTTHTEQGEIYSKVILCKKN